MRVVHCKRSPHDVYIGRPSKWGNPFEIGEDGTREEVIAKFSEWLATGESFGNRNATPEQREIINSSILELKGKTLGCWCSPKSCHGDVLVSRVQALDSQIIQAIRDRQKP